MTAPAIDRLHLSADAADLLFRDARTANAFTDEPVTDEQVRAIYDLVKNAPTAMNAQPMRLVLVRSGEARARLVERMAPGNQDKTAAAPLVAIVAADNRFHEELPRVFPHAPGAKDRFADASVRENAARFNAAIQLGYLILGIRAAGLAAGPMGGYDAAGINADFFPDGEHQVVAVVNIGRPAGNAWRDRLPRLEYDEVVSTV
ncbi:malonic semialdehyde reductase [Luedemannella flava]|uniref:Malonic semialdehyde reductase n=1 Tax=Luedemannella flava TaxID=349316 RepID=A0ABP4XRT2_9ACTN